MKKYCRFSNRTVLILIQIDHIFLLKYTFSFCFFFIFFLTKDLFCHVFFCTFHSLLDFTTEPKLTFQK